MTIPYPLDAFEEDRRVTLRPPPREADKGKIAGIALTVAVHAALPARWPP